MLNSQSVKSGFPISSADILTQLELKEAIRKEIQKMRDSSLSYSQILNNDKQSFEMESLDNLQ